MRAVQTGPLVGLTSGLVLLAALAGTIGLSGAGWVVGTACCVGLTALLVRALARHRADGLGPADRVTLARAVLACGVAALVASSFSRPTPVAALVTLAVVALALDAVDGRVARRTRHGVGVRRALRPGGGRVPDPRPQRVRRPVGRRVGARDRRWRATRSSSAGWLLPWLRGSAPPRFWGKVVAAIQGVVLTVAAAGVLPAPRDRGRPGRRAGPARRVVRPAGVVAVAPSGHLRRPVPGRAGPVAARRSVRTAADPLMTVLAVLAVWFALVAPNESTRLTPGAFAADPARGAPRGRSRAWCCGRARTRDGRVLVGVALAAADPGQGPRHGLLRGARPAVRPGRRLDATSGPAVGVLARLGRPSRGATAGRGGSRPARRRRARRRCRWRWCG